MAAILYSSALTPVGPGMLYGTRTAYTSGGTKTVATETNWIPQTGWTLWGFRVICIGAGAGANNGSGGEGGDRIEKIVSLAEMGNPSTVVVTVGASAVNTAGGYSSFGGFVTALGGLVASFRPLPGEPPFLVAATTPSSGTPTSYMVTEGAPGINNATLNAGHGRGSPSGRRGGGGAGLGGSTAAKGGAVYPHPNAQTGGYVDGGVGSPPRTAFSNSAELLDLFVGAGNPVTTAGANGHTGIGDWPGGGGNNHTSGTGGTGGTPGGGGATGNGGSNGSGGPGVVIVYPLFAKA